MNEKVLSAVEKRKQTIAKKRELKEQKKQANLEKYVATQAPNLAHIKDGKNKEAYNKVLLTLRKYNKNFTVSKTGARYKGNDVIQILVKKRLHQDEILKEANKISKLLGTFDKEGFIDLSVKGDRWYYQGQSDWGDEIVFYDQYDALNDDTFDAFALYVTAIPSSKGGADANNDCLYICLVKILGSKMTTLFPTPSDLKKFLKLPYYSKVDVLLMDKVEAKLKVSINVTGDYTYVSKLSSNRVINLSLINEHYTIENKKKDLFKLERKRSHYDRRVVLFDKLDTGYNGIKEKHLTHEQVADMYDWKTDYILVNKFNSRATLKENYDEFIEMADGLKAETKGRINLYRTGNFKTTALNLFDETTQHIAHPPTIGQVEGHYLNKASQGAIYFTTKGYSGPAYKADIKSMYPSIMNSQATFPIKPGEWQFITSFDKEYFPYGIYRATIIGTTKLFRFNYDNFYTHHDLTKAKQLNLTIKLIIDDQPNFLYYSRDKCITGTELFGEYVNTLYPLKQKGIKGSKQILNVLWGALCEKYYSKNTINNDEVYHIPDDVRPMFCPFNDSKTLIRKYKYDKPYKYGWARIMPFLIASGRSIISKIMGPYESSVIRCHTDGILFSSEPVGIKFGTNIGELADEGYYPNISITTSGVVDYEAN
jgi:hypothetical protein